nr:LuxR C-terminal-related transcriptional regulator [Sediminivirga luteola]
MADLALSERERLILASLRDGESTGTVARRVNLSARTVEGILSRLMRRFGCANRIELLDLGLV